LKARSRPVLAFGQRHRIKLLLGTLIGLAAGGYWAARHFYAGYHLHAALEAVARYDFNEAQHHLAICLQVDPSSARLHLQMARVARRAGRYQKAIEHLRQHQQLEQTNPHNTLEASLLQAQVGDLGAVEKWLQEQVEHDSPDTNLILEALAQGYLRTYRLDDALYCLSRLLERQPDNVLALLARATLWKTKDNLAKAEKDYRHAVKSQPEHRDGRSRFGDFLLDIFQADEALRQFEYLRQRPGGDSLDILLGLARSHWQLGHTEEARRLLDQLLTRDPGNAVALLERGKIALAMESPAAAERLLRRAVAADPFEAQTYYLLSQSLEAGLVYLRNGRDDEGERWLQSVLEQVPAHAATRTALADYYQRTAKADLAALYRRPLTRLSPPPNDVR
jgi:Tfp pilus assembly protein PilF